MNIETLEDFYVELEKIDWVSLKDYDNPVREICKKFGEYCNENGKVELLPVIQLELDLTNFVLIKNEIKPMMTGTDKDGNYTEYPSVSIITEDQIDYIKKRADSVLNDFLKVRYAHISWLLPNRHSKFAQMALGSYIQLLKINFEKLDEEDNKGIGGKIHAQLLNMVFLAQSFKTERKEEIKQLIIEFASKIKPESKNKYLFIWIIRLMIETPKLFKADDLVPFTNKIWDILNQHSSQHSKIDVAKVGIDFSNKTNQDKKNWYRKIAECYEQLSYEREDGANLVAVSFASHAVDYYKKIKDKVKVEELTKRYKYLKENMNLDEFHHKVDVTEIYNECRKIADKVLEKTPFEIYIYLMYSNDILPTFDELNEKAINKKISNPLEFHVLKSIIDHSGHAAEYFSDEDEIIRSIILEEMNWSIQFSRRILIQEIFFRGIDSNKLNTETFISFLRNYSWLGQNIKRTYKQGKTEEYSWLTLIAPAINDYFSQIYFYFMNNNNIPNFVLCIDSLAIKIEGILRDICEITDGTTFFFTKDKKNRDIVREKDINALLHDEAIVQHFSKDDLLFLKFLLVEKAGLNLRNNVAHSLFLYINNYSIDFIHLLIIAILKIAKDENSPLKNKK